MKRFIIPILVTCWIWTGCEQKSSRTENDSESAKTLEVGVWRGVLSPQQVEIPFLFQVNHKDGKYRINLMNGTERIPLEEVKIEGDSVHIPLYIFDATIHAHISDGSSLKGFWVKNYAEDYKVPFEAKFGAKDRFSVGKNAGDTSFDGKWEVNFMDDNGGEKAIGLFRQNGHKVTGTFVLSSGDYRFLEGVQEGNVLKLSCFDGTHAYLFVAKMLPDGGLEGDFWSGKTWHQKWSARRNESFELPDPYSLSVLEKGYDTFDLSFPDVNGHVINLSDNKYKNKVVVLQLLGTWCPNCMDETRFYIDWYKKNKTRGVEIIGLAFERKADTAYARNRVKNMMEKLGVNYDIVIAGTTKHESRAKALPMFNKMMPFPTSLVLDRQHKVRRIHSGFSGPGTGDYYAEFIEDFNRLMDKLLEE